MDIDTSSKAAARKNLVALSMGFLLFVFGEANFVEDGGASKIGTFFGAIELDITVLEIFAWVMLLWFLLRFWQFSRHKEDWKIYTDAMYSSKLMSKWVDEKSGRVLIIKRPGGKDRIMEAQALTGHWVWTIKIGSDESKYTIKKYDILKKVYIFFDVAWRTEHFGQFYFPYLLAFFAIGFGAYPRVAAYITYVWP